MHSNKLCSALYKDIKKNIKMESKSSTQISENMVGMLECCAEFGVRQAHNHSFKYHSQKVQLKMPAKPKKKSLRAEKRYNFWNYRNTGMTCRQHQHRNQGSSVIHNSIKPENVTTSPGSIFSSETQISVGLASLGSQRANICENVLKVMQYYKT